jgi:diguanylate cyclase
MRSFQQNSSKIKRNTSLFYDQIASANQEISNLKKALEKVTKEARYDGLSGLLNRGAFDKDINKHCSGELPSSFCLVILDIDDFKRLNDEYGHVFGDLVIKSVAKKLQAACDTKFSAYRYGGEEFAIILPNTPLKTAVQFSESLRQSIERISIKDKRSGKSITHISASVGVSQTTNGDNQISITDRADRQLYLAKQSGKNRVMPSNADFT